MLDLRGRIRADRKFMVDLWGRVRVGRGPGITSVVGSEQVERLMAASLGVLEQAESSSKR